MVEGLEVAMEPRGSTVGPEATAGPEDAVGPDLAAGLPEEAVGPELAVGGMGWAAVLQTAKGEAEGAWGGFNSGTTPHVVGGWIGEAL